MSQAESNATGSTARAVLIVAAVWWIYAPALHGGWLWDDEIDLLQNPVVHDPAGWWKIWLLPAGWHFFPLKSAVQWLQWQAWQEHTTGYHFTNVVLHILSALLIWRLLGRLGVKRGWLGGLLFAVHPLAVESVAWIAEIKNTLSLPLLLLAADAWLDFDACGRKRDYARALLLFLAAMLGKSSVVMFPVVLLLHAWCWRGRIAWRDIARATPFFLLSVGLGLVTVAFEHGQNFALLGVPDLGFASRLAGAGLAVLFYCTKAIVPTGLSPVYPPWDLATLAPWDFLPWVAVLGLGWLAWKRRETWGRAVALGGGFFLLNLIPVLGFLPMAYHHIAWVADHFVYLPLVGLAGLVAVGVDWLEENLERPRRQVVIGVGLAVAAALAWQSHRYAAAFSDEESFWRRAATVAPVAPLPHIQLGRLCAQTGRGEDALKQYEMVLRLRPRDAETLNNLGNALLARGEVARALACYERATAIRPDIAVELANLANAYVRADRGDDARRTAEQAVQLESDCAPARIILGDLAAQAGQMAAASVHYGVALRTRPDDAVLHHNLAVALAQTGRSSVARGHFEAALRLDPGYAQARVNLGFLLRDLGDPAAAAEQWSEVLRRDPNNREARVALGNLLVRRGQPAEAAAHYEAALRLRADDFEVHNNLAFALAQLGRFDEAVRQVEAALRLRPDDAGARENLARLQALMRRADL